MLMKRWKLLSPLRDLIILLVQTPISGSGASTLDSKFSALLIHTYLLRHYSKVWPCCQRGWIWMCFTAISHSFRQQPSPRIVGPGHQLRFVSLWLCIPGDFPASTKFIREFPLMLNFKKKRIEVSNHLLATKKGLWMLCRFIHFISPYPSSNKNNHRSATKGLSMELSPFNPLVGGMSRV